MTAVAAYGTMLALCLLFAQIKGVLAGATPLLALAFIMVYFSFAGMLGVLAPAAVVLYVAVAVLCAAVLYKKRLAALRRVAVPSVIMFAAFGLMLLIYYAVRQPMISGWDEYVFWGLSAKTTSMSGQLYPYSATGFFWTQTERPALIVLSSFASGFFGKFSPWQAYWAYGMLYIAGAAALGAPFGMAQWRKVVPPFAVGLMLPFFFSVAYETIYFTTAYISLYADLAAGVLFGGVLAVYFAARHTQSALWPAALPLCALALTKDNVVPIALVAAGVMAADLLIFGRQNKENNYAPIKKWGLRLCGAAGFFAVPYLAYTLWAGYAATAAVAGANAGMSIGTTNAPVSQSVMQALAEMFGAQPQSEGYIAVVQSLTNGFLGNTYAADGSVVHGAYKVSMAGTALVTMLLILALFVLCIVLQRGWRQRLQAGVAAALLCGGLLAYHFMLLVVYAFFSHTSDSGAVFDYGRYLSSYLVGFAMLGLVFLATAGKARKALVAEATVLLVCVCMLVRFGALVRPGYSMLDYPEGQFASQQARSSVAQHISAQAGEGERVFYVSQGGNGGAYFETHYHLWPVVLDYSIMGGRSFESNEGQTAPTPQAISDYLEDTNCEFIFIEQLNDEFVQLYGSLFADGLQSFSGAALYGQNAEGEYYKIAEYNIQTGEVL